MVQTKNSAYDTAILGVGIGSNYGSVLTYYSLYRTIERFGKSVVMVSKIGAKPGDTGLRDGHALKFAKKHVELSEPFDPTDVDALNELADTYVIGSDQVWNYGVSPVAGRAFYLDFAADTKRKLSYAASFGHAVDFATDDVRPELSALLKRFNAISVREDTGVTLAAQSYGVVADQVIEPIFLTDNEEYVTLAQNSERDTSEPYLLAYILDPTPEKREAILHLCKKLNLKPRIILDGWSELFEKNKAKMDLDEAIERDIETYDFLKLYADCTYAITDSFHGTCFALKFGKPFATIGNKRRGMTRFESLFRQIGLKDRFTLDATQIVSNDERFLRPIDYVTVDAKINKRVASSKSWLKKALETPITKTVKTHKPASFRTKGLRTLKRKARTALDLLSSRRRFRTEKPRFEANSKVWSVDYTKKTAALTANLGDLAPRGHQVWCELPMVPKPRATYELSLRWGIKTTAKTVNVHIRNPATGKFFVIGHLPGGSDRSKFQIDTVRFRAPDEGFSQLMLGAVHFVGPSAGANVECVTLRKVVTRPGELLGRQVEGVAKSPADVARALSKEDNERFVKHYAQKMVPKNQSNTRALLMFYSHGLEKGLSRGDDFRPGFGVAAVNPLAKLLNEWASKGKDLDDPFFQIALSVMRFYFDRHRQIGFDIAGFETLFSDKVRALIAKSDALIGGAAPASQSRDPLPELMFNRSFSDVVFSRRSVRSFTNDPIFDADVNAALEIALQAPSVCNRQAVRVHMFDDPEDIRAALDLQGGFRGYKMPPRLLLITSHLPSFLFAVERNQPFIDGGLFMMLLLLGFEQVGLGSVCLNTAMSHEKEKAIREILNIPETDVFISFVAIGHYSNDVGVPRSKRVPVSEILVDHRSPPLAAE